MTMEQLLAALDAILAEARTSPDGTEAPADAPLSEDQMARYEALEAKIAVARKSEEIVKRNAAYNVVNRPMINGVAKKVDTYERAFEAYVRTGQQNQDLVVRAQSEAVGSAGGFMVPEEWQNRIVEQLKAFGGLQAAASTINSADGRPLTWLTAANDLSATNSEITPEGGLWDTGADVAFGTRTMGAFKFTTVGASNLPLKISLELLQDSAFDIVGYVSNIFARRIARQLADKLVNGTGVNEPQGILSTQGGIASGSARAAAAPTYAELLAIVHSLDPEYRMGASWLINDATLALLRGVVDGSSRPLLWNQNDDLTGALKGQTLLGYDVVVDQAMPTSAASGSAKAILFGNLKDAYIVREVKGFEMLAFDDAVYKLNGQRAFAGYARYDGMVNDPNAAIASPNHA